MAEATLLEFGDGSVPHGAVGRSGGTEPPKSRDCPVCKQQFSGGDARFCPFDGEPLVGSSRDPAADPLIGAVIDGRYEVLEVLGEGGMGTVYRIRHRSLERPFALKALRRDLLKDDDLPARFIQEAKAAAAVEHPNVVQITDFGKLPTEQPYFVMELLEGDSLGRIIDERGPLSLHRAVGVAVQVAQALAAAHSAGVIHRDLKPDNIHVRPVGAQDVVKVLDFGLAKVAGTSRLTRAGMVFGTPHYMSPEQAGGEPCDHRLDIYALGIVMFEMLTGKLPFEADSFTGVLAKHMYEQPPTVSEVLGRTVGAMDGIVAKCLAKKPADRYATMGDLIPELEGLAARLSIPASPDEPAREERLPVTSVGGRWVWAGVALVVALVVAVILVAVTREPSGGGEPQAVTDTDPPAPSPTPTASAAPARAQAGAPRSEPPAEATASPPALPKTGVALPKQTPKRPADSDPQPPPPEPPKPPKPKTVGATEIIDPWSK